MIELLTNAEMSEADRRTIAAGVRGIDLMENAGRAVAEAVAERHPAGTRVAVVAGPGNNGGDGFVAARVLAERGFRIDLMLVGDAARLKGDAALAAKSWNGPVAAAAPERLAGADVIIDALFGAGLDRPVEGAARGMIEAMNAHTAPVIAVDLPSGINGTSGAVMGSAVRAAQTVTFFRKKPGHLLLPGRLYCGPIRVADIGIPDAVLGADRTKDVRECARVSGVRIFPSRVSTDTNMSAVTPSSSQAAHLRLARRGSRRVARCGPGRGW